MSRAMELNSFHLLSCALVLTLFLFQKGQGFFPPLPIAARFPRRWRWADSNGGAWDSLVLRGWTRCFHGQTCFPIRGWCKPYSNYASWTLRCNLDISARQKASVNLESR